MHITLNICGYKAGFEYTGTLRDGNAIVRYIEREFCLLMLQDFVDRCLEDEVYLKDRMFGLFESGLKVAGVTPDFGG